MSPRPGRRLNLEGELTIINAVEQNQRLLSALEDGVSLDVGLSGVTDLDTAGLQVLLLARREASRRGLTVTYRDASPVVVDVLAVAHLNEALEQVALDRAALERAVLEREE